MLGSNLFALNTSSVSQISTAHGIAYAGHLWLYIV
jgi:hypothetical protein